MRDHFWIDRYTRALLVEANIYNANTNLLMIVTILHEIIPTGGYNFWYNIQALKLYRYVGGMGDIVVLFDIIFMIVTIVNWYVLDRCYMIKTFLALYNNIFSLNHLKL